MGNTLGAPDKAPLHLWIVGVVSLLWNFGGVMSYTSTKLGYLEAMDYPPDMLAFVEGFPAWATAFWALGVWGAFFGSVALLFRSKWAVSLFGIALIGLAGTTVYQRIVADLPEGFQTTGQNLFAAAIWVITIGLFIYASRMQRAGVLR